MIKDKFMKNKITTLIVFVLVMLLLGFILNFNNIFLSESSKKVNFSLNNKKFTNMNIEIKDDEIILPHLKELNTDLTIGKTFEGYDINNDGKADYMPGDSIKITPNFMSMDVDLIISDDDIPFTAWLYDDNTFIKGTELKHSDYTISTPWDYTSQMRYLVINPQFTASVGGTIDITLPVGMQWYDGDTDITTTTFTGVGGDITDVTFTKLSGLSGTGGQGVSNYSNPRTGTITYTYSSLATTEEAIVIPVTFDPMIWDGFAGDDSNLTADFDAIKVTMHEGDNLYSKSLVDISFSKTQDRTLQTYYVPSTYGMDIDYSTYRSYPRELGYYKEIKFIFDIPSKDGVYADYVGEDPKNVLYFDYDIDTSDPTKVTYSASDLYLRAKSLFGQIINLDSSKFNVGDRLNYDYSIEYTSYGGTKRTVTVTKVATVVDNINIKLNVYSKYVSTEKFDGLERMLGSTNIANTGSVDSGRIKIEYLFNKTQEIDSDTEVDIAVRAIKVPQNKNTNFDVEYVLTDYNNNQVGSDIINITSPNSDTDGKMLTIYGLVDDYNSKHNNDINYVPLDPEQTVIKSIKYYIESIPKNTNLYYYGASYMLTSSGNFYGKIISDKNAYTLFTITQYNSDGSIKKYNPLNITTMPVIGTDNSLSIYSYSALDKTSYFAGSNVEFLVPLYMYKYPYMKSQISTHPNMYIVLPNGVELGDNIYATRIDKKYTPTVSSRRLNDALTLYTLKFDLGNDYMGGPIFNEDKILMDASNSPFLNVHMSFKTNPTLEYTPLNLRNTIFVGEDNSESYASTPQNTIEPYDFNGNGKLDMKVTTYEVNNKIISINPNTNQLRFNNEISINGRDFTSDESSKIISDSNGKFDKGVASYRLNIENDSAGLVAGEDFYHYIPVIKKDVEYPSGVNNNDNILDFKLTNEPIITGDNSGIYKYLYTTETSLSDSDGNLKSSVEFKPIEEIENIEDVTMIKVTGNESSLLMPYTKDSIELNLIYEVVNDEVYYSGKNISFSSYGWKKYLDGGITNTNNVLDSTDGVTLYTRYLSEYNKNISNEYEFLLPQYFENKKIYILDVKENNMNLVSKESILSNQDILDVNITDNNFNVMADLNGNTYDLSEFNSPVLLDEILNDSSNKITFNLTTYNNILDSTSPKYVDIYLGDDIGIKYKLRLDIKRESTYIEEVTDTIVSGSYYNVLVGNDTNISLTSNSSYTAQFTSTFGASDTSLNLTSNFKKGTVIKMIDISELNTTEGNYDFEPKYYYYKVDEDQTDILLTSFLNNKDNSNYTYSNASINKFVFIIENNSLPSGNYTIGLNKFNGLETVSEGTLNYTIVDNKQFNLIDNRSVFEIKDNKMDVNLDISSSVSAVDTKYGSSLFGLKINFDTDVPAGSYIEMNDKVYLVEDYDFVLNNDNYFLIPLGNINDPKNIKYTLHAGTNEFEGTIITHSLVLLDEPNNNPVAQLVNNISVKDYKNPALMIKLENQLIKNIDLTNLNLNIKYIDYDDSTNFSAKLYILKKKDNFYLKTVGLINNVEVNNATYTPTKEQVVFDLDDNLSETNIKLNLNSPLYLKDGTYRIILETNHLDTKNVKDITNFIIVE